MSLNEYLSHRHSKQEMLKLAQSACADDKKYSELIECIATGRPPVPRYAAWVLQHCSSIEPDMIIPHLSTLTSILRKDVHNGVRRSVIRAIMPIEIPKKHFDELADICFGFLEDPSEPVAVKVFSMQILHQICRHIPELRPELMLLIETQMPTGSAGFRSRGGKILKELKRS